VKAAMRAGRKAYGYNLSFPSPWVIDILGKLDFDFVFTDGEYGPLAWTSSRTSAGRPPTRAGVLPKSNRIACFRKGGDFSHGLGRKQPSEPGIKARFLPGV